MATTTTSVLSTAGLSPNQYGTEVALDAANKSVMRPLVRTYNIAKGNTLYIPKVGTRSVTKRVRGTNDADNVTYAALSDTAVTFSKTFAVDALEISYESLNDMPAAHLAAWLNAEKSQMGSAVANQFDADTLGLYSVASDNVGDSSSNVSGAMLKEAIKALRVANAPGPYFIVLPETQWDHLADIDELTRFDVRGEGDTMQNRQAFKLHGVMIFTTGNVPTAAGTSHGLAFSGEGIAAAMRDEIVIKEWDNPNNFTQRIAAYTDYAYANTFADWIVDIQTTTA